MKGLAGLEEDKHVRTGCVTQGRSTGVRDQPPHLSIRAASHLTCFLKKGRLRKKGTLYYKRQHLRETE